MSKTQSASRKQDNNPAPVLLDQKEKVGSSTLWDLLQEAQIQSNLKSATVMITPELAAILLGNNEGNRPKKQRVLDTYVRDMQQGNFRLTGETIILDENGLLMNGQHRLNACILAGVPFPAMIVSGVPRRAFLDLDSGEKRRAADWLSSGNYSEQNAKTLAAALRVLWTFDQGAMCSQKRYPSNDEIAHTLEQHGKIRQFVSSTFTKSVKGMPGSLVAALRYLFGQYNDEVAAEFFARLSTGEMLRRDHPILKLRNKLASEEHLSQLEVAALTIKAWNAAGDPLTTLRYKKGEEFPKIAGLETEYKKIG